MAEYNELIEQYKKKLKNSTDSITDYASLYQSTADALVSAQEASYQSKLKGLEEQLINTDTSYDAARNEAYENARLSAVRSNEVLASLGLAGKLDSEAKSGVSESSRIAADNALRESINLLNAEQIKSESEIERQKQQAGYEKEQSIAAIMSEYTDKISAYQAALREYENELKKLELQKQEFEAKQLQNQAELQLKQNQADEEKRQTAIENAMKEISVFGKIMTKEAAEALGLPIGTMSYSVATKERKKGSSGSAKSSKLSEKVSSALEKARSYLSTPTDTYYAAYNASLYGISAKELPAYQAKQYLAGQVRERNLTEKQASQVKKILGI